MAILGGTRLERTLRGILPRQLRRSVLQPARVALGSFLVDTGRRVLGIRDDLLPPTRYVCVGDGDFRAVGYEFLRYFVEFGRLRPHEAVLDIGCGIGRMAIPLTQFLRGGRYDGIDVVPRSIEWCQRHITPRWPNFRFQLADVHNEFYNPRGRHRAAEYAFPFPDSSFDFVLLTSVFTHLLDRDTEHYVREIGRLLRPRGRVLCTWFLLNDESRRLMALHPAAPQIVHPVSGSDRCLTQRPESPEAMIGHDERQVRSMFQAAGLQIEEPVHYGAWCARADYTSYQDIVVATRASGRPA
jgi:SAM-dependent methyltransferase